MGKRFVSSDALRLALGEDAFVVLESEDAWKKKVAEGKTDQAWGFSLATGSIRRADDKFHELVVGKHSLGYPIAIINEEPAMAEPEDGSPRVVGQIIIERNAEGKIRVRNGDGLSGKVLELMSSSVSKGELTDSGAEFKGLVQANAQRIKGHMAVYVRAVELFAADALVMTPAEFVEQSTDGRGLAALAKAGLLK